MDLEQNKDQIRKWLQTAPSDWKLQFNSGMQERGLLGLGEARGLTLENALLVLGITAGGNYSGDQALGKNRVPDAVRLEAMHGLELSHRHNYGAWNFIGIARAIQLATQPGVPNETSTECALISSGMRRISSLTGLAMTTIPHADTWLG